MRMYSLSQFQTKTRALTHILTSRHSFEFWPAREQTRYSLDPGEGAYPRSTCRRVWRRSLCTRAPVRAAPRSGCWRWWRTAAWPYRRAALTPPPGTLQRRSTGTQQHYNTLENLLFTVLIILLFLLFIFFLFYRNPEQEAKEHNNSLRNTLWNTKQHYGTRCTQFLDLISNKGCSWAT